MKYLITDKGKLRASLLIKQKRSLYRLESKILMTLNSQVAYDIDSLIEFFSNDVSIIEKVNLATVNTSLDGLMLDGDIIAIDEKPLS